jgi:penicillin amidase
MSKKMKFIAGVLGATAGLAGASYFWLLKRPLPAHKGALKVPGLTSPVEIIRDRWAIPHIFAQNETDAFFAQGFVHAQERLFQMDFNRRMASGRLSEVLGERSLPLDRWMRILGLRRAAQGSLALLNNTENSMLEAFAAGVNAWIARNCLPVEFTLLHYQPESWTPLDTLTWAKMMAWYLSVNWESELQRARLLERLGEKKAADLEPPDYPAWPQVTPPGMYSSRNLAGTPDLATEARSILGPTAIDGLGSNNWVIGPGRSQTGLPLLANDMHLSLTIPAIWFENHLAGGQLNVSGISFPGVPGVMAGHNAHVAWGFTNGFADVQDLYIEQIRRNPTGSVDFLYQDDWQPAEVLHEKIYIKGSEPVIQEVILTRHGPIISALAQNLCNQQSLALRWTAYEPDNIFNALWEMNLARDCLEFRQALRHWSVPVQNIVYADRKGNIAYSLPGKIPVRAKGDGRLPVPGWNDEYEWTGYIPFEELPHLYNPPQGYIASANNRVVGDDYPYPLGIDHVAGSRAQRIAELIEAEPKIDVDTIRRMHQDQISPAARVIGEALGRLSSPDVALQAVIEQLRNWDGNLRANSPEAAIYQVFSVRLALRLLEEPLGELAPGYIGKGPTPILAERSIMGERAREWLRKILSDSESPWFPNADPATRTKILLQTLAESIDFLKETCGTKIEDWSWGKLHHLAFNHPLGSVKHLDRLFNRGPYPIGGDHDTIWAAGSSLYDLGNNQVVGPPFRFIADLSDWNNCLGMLVPGQSGHPGSRHYAGNITAWFRGEYHPMVFDREAIEKAASARLVLS